MVSRKNTSRRPSGFMEPEAVGPVVSALGVAVDLRAITAHHQPEAIMLDLVNP